MMRWKTMANQSKRLDAVHARALKRMDGVWKVQEAIRAECLDDRRFCSIRGAQWDEAWTEQFKNAPRMEIDKTSKELVRIFSEYRNNRISVDFRPDDEDGDEDTADALDGLYRADFEDGGQEAQDNAFEEGVAGGMGAWRLRATYEDESDPDNDKQKIRFEPITDADKRVFFGPSLFKDKRDAKWCIVLNPIPEEEFIDEYGEKADSDFPNWPQQEFGWYQDKIVTLAEYYEIDQVKTEKVTLEHPVIEDEKTLFDPEAEEISELEAQGWKVARRRSVKKPKVTKYTLSGCEVLDEEPIAGPNIPILVFYAKRAVIENVEHCSGHVRKAKDPQRVYNAQVSQLAEIAAISPLERPIFDPAQVAGLESDWADGNIKRHPYALARALRNEDGSIAQTGAVGKVEPTQVPAALAALIQLAGQDIADITGSSEEADDVPSNTSAQAIELVHQRVDAKTFIYTDNFGATVQRCGTVWKGMAAELYVEEGRKMRSLDDKGGEDYIEIGKPALDKSGAQITTNVFDGNYRCIVDVGPSSRTRRDATVRSLVGMAAAASQAEDRELAAACIAAALAEMDGEGISDLKKWVRMRAVKMGILQPTDEEKQELAQQAANQQPDPNAALVAATVEEKQASAMQKHSDAILKTAQASVLGGPERAPEVPTGLKAVHEAVQIRKTAAEADNLETSTAHMPLKLHIEAANAETNRLKATKSPTK
jgi:hypothetical protein